MESLFFNLSDRKYKVSTPQSGIKRVDISQGLVFFDVKAFKKDVLFRLDFIDKMLVVFVVKSGKLVLNRADIVKQNSMSMFCYTGGDLDLVFKAESEIFVMFVADFFLKNYLSDKDSLVNKLYQKMQKNSIFEEIYSYNLDRLSSFFVQRLLGLEEEKIQSLKAESLSLELLLHFLEISDSKVDSKDLELANRAKEEILKSFTDDLTIKELAKLCDTNQTKLKKVFKEVFDSTIYTFIQELRLKKAYLLLRDEDYTVGEVSKMVGYSHQGNFSKLFRKKYKIEPSLINKNPFLAK